ncbi:MAG: electron transfer flavoprotein subunit alpha/FixB family protein, partial [Bacteroidota bacterium]
MANKILVFIEQRNGKIKKSSLEAVKAASDIAQKLSGSVEAISIGNEIENLEKVGGFGAGKVTHFKNADLENYSPSAYTDIIAKYSTENNIDLFFFAATSMGKDLAPRVAVKTDSGLAMDCILLNCESNDIIATRPIYAGKALIDVKLISPKKVFALRPNVFNPGIATDKKAEVSVVNVESPNLSVKVVDIKKSEGKIDVAEA